ncbi:unnamed protein product [Linum tenue]|uniref:Uncharacterized protein n=1 Tax=Linum tenue TaxID=586396 RepID=A0AAV0HZ60_9ROSI|nr:unnamed protein product [Linum tenue]
MVTSISSDAAIWDAVMNNEVVRELRHAYYPVEEVYGMQREVCSVKWKAEGSNGICILIISFWMLLVKLGN